MKLNQKFLVSLTKIDHKVYHKYVYCKPENYFCKIHRLRSHLNGCAFYKLIPLVDDVRYYHATKDSFFKKLTKSDSLPAFLVKNSSEKIKPYLKLMRLHQPAGKKRNQKF